MKCMLMAVGCLAIASMTASAQKSSTANGDQKFVDFAAQTDMVEANLGQLASSTAAAQDVKDYGQMLTTDHTKDYGQLMEAAKQANLDVPSSIDAAHNKEMIDPFQKLKGAAFDRKFTQEMIAGHTKAIAMYKKEAADAQNPALKTYAQNALPVLESHLSAAKNLGKKSTSK